MIIHKTSYPRAALIGNPSDGYFGKTIAFVFSNFSAQVTLYETPELKILPHDRDHSVFSSVKQLVRDVQMFGYYGGIRLLKATVKKFHEHCQTENISLDNRNFTIRYQSDIPHQLGLAGSSAIISACMLALMDFFGVEISRPILANLVLAVETEELNIAAGLQDRVAQAYEQPVFMDFSQEIMEKQGYGDYQVMSPDLFPSLYIAYQASLSESTEILHNDLRERYHNQVPEVLNAITEWGELTLKAKEILENGQGNTLGELLNRNFDLRRAVCKVSSANEQMVDIARSVGASAKFTGSGGAIIGTYTDEKMYLALSKELEKHNIKAIKPEIVCNQGEK